MRRHARAKTRLGSPGLRCGGSVAPGARRAGAGALPRRRRAQAHARVLPRALTGCFSALPPQLKAKFKAFAEFGDHDHDHAAEPEAPAAGAGSGAAPASPKPADAPSPQAVRIDQIRFAKLCRDCGLVDGKKMPLGGIDVAFEGGLATASAKGLDTSGRKLDYAGWLLALESIAKALGVPLKHVQLWICGSEPLQKATQTESLAASRPLEGPAEPTEPLKPQITANTLFKRSK